MPKARKIYYEGKHYASVTELAMLHSLPRTTVRDRLRNGDRNLCRPRYAKDDE